MCPGRENHNGRREQRGSDRDQGDCQPGVPPVTTTSTWAGAWPGSAEPSRRWRYARGEGRRRGGSAGHYTGTKRGQESRRNLALMPLPICLAICCAVRTQLADSRARRPGLGPVGRPRAWAFLERGPLPCGENPLDWAVRVGVVAADRAGGHGARQQSSQRRVGGGNTVDRVSDRLPDGDARSLVCRA